MAGVRLRATLIFDYPSPKAVADYILNAIGQSDGGSDAVVDTELDRLEQTLTSTPVDESDRVRIAGRLQAILQRLGDGDRQAESTAVAGMMEAATADEIFDFIDRELPPA